MDMNPAIEDDLYQDDPNLLSRDVASLEAIADPQASIAITLQSSTVAPDWIEELAKRLSNQFIANSSCH